MGGQARGTDLVVNIYEEAEYGSAPDPANGQRVYPTGCTLSNSQELQTDPTLMGGRGKSKPDLGNKNVAGGLPMKLAAEDIATLLKHAFGQVTTYRPVVTQPTNVTGVTVNRAESSAVTGDGTLSYVNSSTSLTWAANGDTAGAAVDVSAGGSFTLESGTDGSALYVTVDAGSLPASDKSDTIPVVDAYEHEFTIGDLPIGLTIERDYGSKISGSGRFEQFHGCRVGSMAVAAPQNDYASIDFQFMGADSTPASAALDADPDDNGHTSFHTSRVTTLEEGGSAIATVTEWSASLNNNLDEDAFVLGGTARGDLTEGDAMVTGSLTALFKDTALLNKATNNTASSLRSVIKRGTGDGTAGNEYVETEITDLVYERKSPPVDGPRGVRSQLNFQGYESGSDLGMKMIVRNQVASP